MTLHRVRDKENTRSFLATIPPALFPMIAKFAVSCTDIDLSDHRGDDCAAVATALVAASWEAGMPLGRLSKTGMTERSRSPGMVSRGTVFRPPRGPFNVSLGVLSIRDLAIGIAGRVSRSARWTRV